MATVPAWGLRGLAMGRGRGVALVLTMLCFVPSGAVAQAADQIEPADVFVRVAQARARIERIRFEMGRPRLRKPVLHVANAAPREVYFQALTLFRKANRLSFELTRERADVPPTPAAELSPADVLHVIDQAIAQLQHVEEALEISGEVEPLARDPSRTPTDVFQSIVHSNGQMNLLLDRRFSPSDVFQQITLAISYASILLAEFPESTRIPPAPELERGKQPADVYRRLLGCYEQLGRIAANSNVSMLEVTVSEEGIVDASPSDVYDIASLLVAALAHFHSRLSNAGAPRAAYYPGQKTPSQVFQRSGILEAQLAQLATSSEAHPAWIAAADPVR